MARGSLCVKRAQWRAKRAQNHAQSVRRIMHEACAESRAKRACVQAPFPCFLPYTVVKIGINIQLDMANSSRVFVSGSCSRSAHNRVQSLRSELSEHRYFFSLHYTAMRIGMNVQLDMADGSRVFVSGSCARSVHNHSRMVRSELCKHH